VPLRDVGGWEATFERSAVAFAGAPEPASCLTAMEELCLLIEGGVMVDGVRGGRRLPGFESGD